MSAARTAPTLVGHGGERLSASEPTFERRTATPAGDAAPAAALDHAFLGAIVESSDDAIVGLNLDGSILSWNSGAARIFGYAARQAIGKPVTLLVPSDLREEHAAILARVRAGERVDHFETARVTRDGLRIQVSLSVSPVRDASGTVSAVSEIARNIDALKRAERAAAQLAAIIESSEDAVVSKSLDGVIQSWNAGATRIYGYTAQEMVGRHITAIIPPELHGEERDILENIRAGRRVEHFETVRVAKDGRRIPVSLSVSPIRDVNGNVIGASKIGRDISDRRDRENELRDSRRMLAAEAAALAQLSEASSRLWRCNSLAAGLDEIMKTVMTLMGAFKGNVQLLNPGRDVLSIVAHRGFDASFMAAFGHLPVGDQRAACGRALALGQPVIIEDVLEDAAYAHYRGVARASGYRAVVSVPLFATEGSRLGAITIHFPAPHRPSEAEMRRLLLFCRQASDFIQRIRLEHHLRENEEALREADRRKDEFLALLAHELRNPLAPIRYALALLRKPGLTGEQKERSEAVVERQVAHMSRLLDDLLDISRITRGTLDLKKSRVDLQSVIAASLEAARPFVEAREHAIAVRLPEEPVYLDADPVRLAQVFSNLLINAAKYTNEGGHIELSVADGRGDVVVTVRDDGIGIAPDMMPRLFTLFSQAQTALARSEGGLGVGLALVRGLVTLHGGRVEAKSDGPGRGSEFTVRLPTTVQREAPAGPPALEPPAPAAGLRILVVDDNRDAADSCSTLLELSGHRVQTAYTGEQAMQAGESFRPDIILLDIGLPDVTGYEVALRVRAAGWGARTTLVAVTGWGQAEDRRRAFEAGFDHHLTKPVAAEAIEALINGLVPAAAPH